MWLKTCVPLYFSSSFVNAGVNEMKDTLDYLLPGNGTDRSLTDNLLDEYFFSYGCWCNFDSDSNNVPGTGRGAPMDDWDRGCRQLQEGYKCAMMDASARGEPCEPWKKTYSNLGHGMDESLIQPICETTNQNADQCTIDACVIETSYVTRIANTILPGAPVGTTHIGSINFDYVHQEGFDNSQNCVASSTGGQHQMACCGEFPQRYPYSVATKECCSDGSIRLSSLEICPF